MTCRKCVFAPLVLMLIFLGPWNAHGQAPDIAYPARQTYALNKTIPELIPVNKGGSVPATIYGQVTTFGGSGSVGATDGQSVTASFNQPRRLAVDNAGNIYVADFANNHIRKITAGGTVSTVLTRGASFNGIDGIAIDAAGNIYVTDEAINSIDQVNLFGDVSTIAGNGGYGSANGPGNMATFNYPIGIAMDRSGNIYVADYQNQLIRKIDASHNVTTLAGSGRVGTNNGTGAAASFSYPNGVGVDAAGNVYVADGSGRQIRKISPAGVVTTFAATAGGKPFVFGDPQDVVIDPLNNVYVTDGLNNQLFKITPSGEASVVAGSGAKGSADGIGASASFNGPVGITIGADGSLYVADSFNNLIRKVTVFGYTIDKQLPAGLAFDSTTGTISGMPTTVSPATDYTVTAYNSAGSSSAIVNIAVLNSVAAGPPNISYASPQTYTVNKPISVLSPTNIGGPVPPNIYGQVTTVAGTGKAGSANGTGKAASFSGPLGLCADAGGDIFVGDYNNNLIREITPAAVVSTYAGAVGSHGATNGNRARATFTLPEGVVIDKSGNMYIADSYNQLIRMISPTGVVSTLAGQTGVIGSADGINATFNSPSGVAVDNSGNVYVADQGNNLVRKITPTGVVSTLAGNAGVTGSANGMNATFNVPTGIAIDNSQNLYVADAGNNMIRRITSSGLVSTFAGSNAVGSADGLGQAAGFNYPCSVAIDQYGTMYVADEHNNIIRKITPDGNVTTLAGSGNSGSLDGLDKQATFSYPGSITADNLGSVFVGDVSTFMIRKIAVTGYTIDKPLPPGLTFDQRTGNISGTPTAISPATNYTVTAYNSLGSSSTIINIAVDATTPVIVAPIITYQTPQKYFVKVPITPLAPTNTGGAVPANIYGLVTTFAGTGIKGNTDGSANTATFNGPAGLAFDASGNLFVSDAPGSDIRKITPSGAVSTFAGTGRQSFANGPGNVAGFDSPNQLAFDGSGNLYVADKGNQLIRKITKSAIVSTYAGSGTTGSTDGSLTTATLNDPVGFAIDPTGTMYIADQGNSTIRKINQVGQVSTFTIFNGGAAPPSSDAVLNYLTTDISGNLYIVNRNQVGSITPAGTVTMIAGSGNPAFADGAGASASFFRLVGIARNSGGYIYVADGSNNRIRSVSPSGLVTTIAGEFGNGFVDGIGSTASFSDPYGLALDPTGNYLFVADYGNNKIRQVVVTGYTIDKSLPTGLIFDPTTGTISGTPTFASPPIIYTITGYNQGGSSTTSVSIEIDLNQTIVFNALPPKTVCDADFNPDATGSGPITYTSDDPSIATIVSGNIHITGSGTTTIVANDGTSQAARTLTVTDAITPTISITPASADTCAGKTMVFAAQVTGGGTQPLLQWQINGQNTGSDSQELSTDQLNNGDKITCVLTSNATCTTSSTVTSNTAVFTIDPPVSTSVKITASDTGLICKGTPVTFTAVAFSPDAFPTYQWQVNGSDAGADQSTFTTTTLNDGDIVTCIMTSVGKCLIDPATTSNSIKISLSPQSQCIVEIPNTFTPNGDGINDLWDITALPAYPGCTISIYNRTGSLIYNSINYPKPWDGTYNGKRLPVGTYYYIIDLKNGKKPLSGPVTIIR